MWPFKSSASTVEELISIIDTAVGVATEIQTEVKAETVVAEPDPEPVLPSAHPVRDPKITPDEMQEYIRVAEAVGLDSSTDLTRERLLQCFRDENIHVYNMPQVVKYLDAKLGPTWEWRGLRNKDARHLKGWFTAKTETRRRVVFADEPYRGAIPLPVLLTVEKIQKALPNEEIYFYVSAPKDNDGDPFLCVTSRWMELYIIERWGEPNFRER